MWKKILITTLLFCFFALLQDSFFTHFILFGAVPNLVFALFFTFAFFAKKIDSHEIISLAIIAGFFLDIFSYTFIGPSIFSLIIVGILLKKIQSALTTRDETYPFSYFLPLFIIFLLLNDLLIGLYAHFVDANKLVMSYDKTIISYAIYSSIFASIFFLIYKKNLKRLQQW
jgi:rod shape-determining protein MreD